MNRRVLIAVAGLVCFEWSLFATTCAAPPPPCAIIPAQGVWFIGVVIDVRAGASDELYPVHIRLRVDENFSGLAPGVNEVAITQAGGGMEEGASYLVSARRLGDLLIVDTCTVTGLVSSKANYVDYLRKAAAGELPPTASLIIEAPNWYGPVKVVGPDGEQTVRTDLSGVAKLEGIKPGRYRLVYDGPRYRLTYLVDEVEAWAGSCPSLIFGLRP